MILAAGCAGRGKNSHAAQDGSQYSHGMGCNHDHGDVHDHLHDHDHDHPDHDHSHHAHGSDDGYGHSHGGQGITDVTVFPAAQAARLGIVAETIEPVPFRDVIRVSGDITAAQGDTRAVIAPVAGVVSFAGRALAPGTRVGSGEVLFHISSRYVAGGDSADKARAAYQAARSAYERAELLLPDNIISRSDYEDVLREYLHAKSEWEALSENSTDR